MNFEVRNRRSDGRQQWNPVNVSFESFIGSGHRLERVTIFGRRLLESGEKLLRVKLSARFLSVRKDFVSFIFQQFSNVQLFLTFKLKLSMKNVKVIVAVFNFSIFKTKSQTKHYTAL